MNYILKIADISILVDVPYFLNPSYSTKDFIRTINDEKKVDIRFKIFSVKKLQVRKDVVFKEARRAYVGTEQNTGIYFSAYPDTPPYAFAYRDISQEGYVFCEYLEGSEHLMNYARNLITLIDIEATLLSFSALILHASLIRLAENGIIFSAPSGTGKSTQAELWERFEGADILNGDRAAIRRVNGLWRAYGLPYAGTSGIYRNESSPIRAIIALKQAKENQIRRITGAEAFRYLYPETLIHRWDPDFESRATNILLDVIGEIPVFLLECRPDRDAVEILKKEIHSLENEGT